MDLLLSLPIASYFLAGTTSWTTSLNVLFFYITWTTLVLTYSPLRIQLAGLLAIRLLAGLAPSLLFLLVDSLLPSLAAGIKYGGTSALPPRSFRRLGVLLLLALLNLVLEGALSTSLGLIESSLASLSKPLPLPSWLRCQVFPLPAGAALPLPWQIMRHIALLLVVREALTYGIHRFVLSSSSWPTLSRWHAQGPAHARDGAASFSLLLFADHPVSFLLHRTVPLLGAAAIVRPHVLVFFLFAGLVTIEETLAMSGYRVVPGWLLSGIVRRTAAHYASAEEGPLHSFGPWGILDWVLDTSAPQSNIVEDAQEAVAKHEAKAKRRRRKKASA